MKTLAEFLEVEEGQEFQFSRMRCASRYRVKNNVLETYIDKQGWKPSDRTINRLIGLLEEYEIVKIYSPSTIEAAKHDSYRFKYVARNDNQSDLRLFNGREPKYIKGANGFVQYTDIGANYGFKIKSAEYPEVKPGQCVELREIVGGEKQ